MEATLRNLKSHITMLDQQAAETVALAQKVRERNALGTNTTLSVTHLEGALHALDAALQAWSLAVDVAVQADQRRVSAALNGPAVRK